MESIKKLREMAADINSTEIIDHLDWTGGFVFRADWLDSWHSEFDRLCDEIEREIAERYMKLPVDADGVPIRMYDCISEEEFAPSGGHVVGFKLYEGQPDWLVNCGAWVFARKCRHVKPRTLEDVLREMLDRNSDGIGLREFNRDFNAFVEHYAAEIRELMEVDE